MSNNFFISDSKCKILKYVEWYACFLEGWADVFIFLTDDHPFLEFKNPEKIKKFLYSEILKEETSISFVGDEGVEEYFIILKKRPVFSFRISKAEQIKNSWYKNKIEKQAMILAQQCEWIHQISLGEVPSV